MFELINELVSLPIVNEDVGSDLYFVAHVHDGHKFDGFGSTPQIFFTDYPDANRHYIYTIDDYRGLYDSDDPDEIKLVHCKFTGRKIAPIDVTKRLIKDIAGDDSKLLSFLSTDELQELSTLMHRRGYDAAMFLDTVGDDDPVFAKVKSIMVFNPGKHIQITSFY